MGAATGGTLALRGLVVAGTPLGEDEFVRETAAGKAAEAQCAVAALVTSQVCGAIAPFNA